MRTFTIVTAQRAVQRSFLLRLLPIHHGLTYTMGLISIRAHVAARDKTCTPTSHSNRPTDRK
jgi:hypothetical protein